MINIMIMDDHVLFREGLKALIEKDKNLRVVCEAASETEFIHGVRNHDIDIILLDINMPDKDGIKILEFIRKKKIDIKVILLTMHNEIEYLVKAVDLKTDGYLLKTIHYDELYRAIYEVNAGKDYIQPELLPYLNNYLINRDSDKDKIKLLTSREMELLAMVSSGMKNMDIAKAINISERTVKNHLSHIFEKLEVNDRTQAAVFAIKNNITRI